MMIKHHRRSEGVHIFRVCRLALAVAVVGLMSGCNFGSLPSGGNPLNQVSVTDSKHFTVRFRSLTVANSNASANALDDQYNPTDLSVTRIISTTCTDANADMCIFDNDYDDNGVFGWAVCEGAAYRAHPFKVCSLSYVRYNTHVYPFPAPSASRLACHEIGHTVGLQHSDDQDSCLSTYLTDPSGLTTHDRDHLNNFY